MNRIQALTTLVALGGIGAFGGTERGSRGYNPRPVSHWDAKKQSKIAKKQQRQNKKKNRRAV